LRTQGAFLVSAVKKGGKTQWVRVKSLAGEPCRIKPGIEGVIKATVPMKEVEPGIFDLQLKKGEEGVLYTGMTLPELRITPVEANPSKCNFYGLKAK
jgi:hypothetical protein